MSDIKTKQHNSFNPVKEDVDGVKARRAIWTTKAINLALKGLEEGRKLVTNPFYENNTKLLKGDLVFQRTPEEIEEFKHCMNDIVYFAEKYCQLMTPEGIKHIILRDYQIKYLKHLQNNRLSIYLACRQCSKTTMSAIFMLHYVLFNTDKNALVLGNKRKTAVEILDKVKKIFFEIPQFLKPGVYKWNEGEIVLDNGCRIMAEATTINSGISFTFHCVLADEFAHIAPNIKEKFYSNLFPTITAGKARFMITSTQNGYDLFSRLYMAAEAGENEYAPFKTDWYEVPEWNPEKRCWEQRDEAWHKRQVANYGSEEAFNAQFGTSFDVSANSLIDSKIMRKQELSACEFIRKEMPGVIYSQYFFWQPDFNLDDLKKHPYCITIDISEGNGGDYTVFTINKLHKDSSDKDRVLSNTVGFFKCNIIDTPTAANILYSFCTNCMTEFNCQISLEYNLYGELFVRCFRDSILKGTENGELFDEDNILRYYNEDHTKFTYGKRITAKSKAVGVNLFKQQYERGYIQNNAIQFIHELRNFCDSKGNGTYQASFGHDDLVMSQLQIVFATETQQVKEMIDYFDAQSNVNVSDNINFNPYESQYPQPFNNMSDIYNYMNMVNMNPNQNRLQQY